MKSVVSNAHNIHGRDISLWVSRRWMTIDLDQRLNTTRSTEAPGHAVDTMDHIDRLNEIRLLGETNGMAYILVQTTSMVCNGTGPAALKRCVKTPKFAWPVLPASAIDPIKKFPANLEASSSTS